MTELILLHGVRCIVTDCITCGIPFAVPEAAWNHQRAEGGYHHCPNGHSQGWGKEKSEREQLRRERDNLKQQIARVEDEKRWAVRAAEGRAALAIAAQKRTEKRAKAALCPCCNRSFVQLRRHMASKHKGVALLKAEKVA